MSKKHFIKLAEWIRDYNRDDNATAGPNFDDRQIAMLADFCEEQNPLFKRDRWIAYIKGEYGQNGGRRTPDQKKTHVYGVVARDKFMSGWGGASGGASRCAWELGSQPKRNATRQRC